MKKTLINKQPQSKVKKLQNIDPVGKAFGLIVRQLRKDQGLSQEALANLAEIERAHMGCIERGEKVPSISLLLKIAKALKLSSTLLMKKTEEIVEDVAIELAKNKPIPIEVQIASYFKKLESKQ